MAKQVEISIILNSYVWIESTHEFRTLLTLTILMLLRSEKKQLLFSYCRYMCRVFSPKISTLFYWSHHENAVVAEKCSSYLFASVHLKATVFGLYSPKVSLFLSLSSSRSISFISSIFCWRIRIRDHNHFSSFFKRKTQEFYGNEPRKISFNRWKYTLRMENRINNRCAQAEKRIEKMDAVKLFRMLHWIIDTYTNTFILPFTVPTSIVLYFASFPPFFFFTFARFSWVFSMYLFAVRMHIQDTIAC